MVQNITGFWASKYSPFPPNKTYTFILSVSDHTVLAAQNICFSNLSSGLKTLKWKSSASKAEFIISFLYAPTTLNKPVAFLRQNLI